MRNLIIVVLLGAAQAGCVSKMISKIIPQEGKQVVQLNKIKKIAIVAYDTHEYLPPGVLETVVPMLKTASSASNMKPVESELSLSLYADLKTELELLKYKVTSLEQVRDNQFYKNLMAKMSNVNRAGDLGANTKPTMISGIARPTNPKYQFAKEDREELARSLGVDALVFARIKYHSYKNPDYSGMGLQQAYLKPSFAFYMFGGQESELIWFATQSEGPLSKEPLGRFAAFANKDVIVKESRSLAVSAMRTFLSKTIVN